jgi:hypothetical protein
MRIVRSFNLAPIQTVKLRIRSQDRLDWGVVAVEMSSISLFQEYVTGIRRCRRWR